MKKTTSTRRIISGNQKEFDSKIPTDKSLRKAYFKNLRTRMKKAKSEYNFATPKSNLSKFELIKYKYYDKVEKINKCNKDKSYSAQRKFQLSIIKKERILALREYKDNWKAELSKKKKTFNSIKNNNLKNTENETKYNDELAKLKANHLQTINKIEQDYKNKQISKKARNDEKTKQNFIFRSDKLDLNNLISKKVAAEDYKFHYLKYLQNAKKIKKTFEANIVFTSNEIPNDERFKSRKIIAPLLEFIFPGLGSLINREYGKGVITSIGTLFIYGAALLFSLGVINVSINGYTQGDGILGLITLGSHSNTYQPDSRFYLVFGILSIIFICIALVYGFLMSRIARKKALSLYIGADNARLISTKRFLQNNGFPYMIASPIYLVITFTTIFPLLTSMIIVFTNFGSKGHIAPAQFINWVGFENLKAVFDFKGAEGQYFLKTLSWSFIWGIGSSLTSVFSGLALALLVNHPRLKGKKYIRPLFMLPMAVPFFIIVLYFKIFFGPTGAMNHDVVRAFAPWNPITQYEISPGVWRIYADKNWFSDVATVKFLLFFINIWLNFAGTFLFVTGLLQGISKDLYEAAEIAGAGPYKKFMNITGPMLLYRVSPLLISAFIGGFNNFGLIYLFVEGGPHVSVGGPGETDILASYVFNLVQKQGRPAVAASYMFVISFVFGGIGVIGFSRTKIFREDTNKKKAPKKPRKIWRFWEKSREVRDE